MTIDEKAKSLAAADWVIIAGYFILCVTIGLWSKFKRQRGREETAETYFLAGRSMMWWAVGPSLFASNIGSEHFIGLAGSGAATGVGVASYEWEASWFLLILGWVFVPIYLKSRVYTMPEYVSKRFQSKSIRTVITIVALISCVFTKTSVDIYAGSVFLFEAIGWNIYVSSICILAITAVYTMLGGLIAVIFTDILQCVIMIVGAIVLAIISFVKVGGIEGLWEKFPDAVGTPYTPPTNNSLAVIVATNSSNQSAIDACFKVTPYWGNMFRPINDPHYPWLGLITTLPILEVWYWCTDQVIVQRALSAKNTTHAKAGTIMAALLKILPMFIMVMPGMISRVLFKDSIGCADKQSCKIHCDNEYACTNNAYPKLVMNVLPTGLVGLMMAVMMAALMSSLSSAFNSSATVFTVDVWDRFRPKASQREQLIVGRVCVFLMVILSLCWLPIIKGSAGQELFVYLQTVQSYLASPLTMTYLLGILWPGLTEFGTLSGLAVGFFLGLIKFIMGNVFPKPPCGETDDRPSFVKMHFMFYAVIVFAVVGIVMFIVSMFTKKIPRDQLGGLTWSTIDEPPLAQSPKDIDIHLAERGNQSHGSILNENTKADEEKTNIIEEGKLKKLEVVQFPDETPLARWALRAGIAVVLAVLIFLWIWFR